MSRHPQCTALLVIGLLLLASCGDGSAQDDTAAEATPAAEQATAAATAASGGPAGAASGEAETGEDLAAMLPQEITDKGELVVGALMDVPPMDFYTEQEGTPTGINPDLGQLIGEELGIDVTFREFDFGGLQPALQSGEIDVIWDSINDTVERQEVLDFVDYLLAGTTLLLTEGNPEGIESLADMCGLGVATVRGAVQIQAVEAASDSCEEEGAEPIELRLFGAASEGRLQVQSGRVDAFIGNAPVLIYLADTAEDGGAFDAVTLESEAAVYYGIALEKSDTELRDALSAALQAVMDSGGYADVLTEYGLSDLAVEKPTVNAGEL